MISWPKCSCFWQTPAKKSKRRANDDGDEDSDDDEVGDDEAVDDDDDDESPDIDMHWNLASYLPEAGACRKNLYTVIIGELDQPYLTQMLNDLSIANIWANISDIMNIGNSNTQKQRYFHMIAQLFMIK